MTNESTNGLIDWPTLPTNLPDRSAMQLAKRMMRLRILHPRIAGIVEALVDAYLP